ncbi:MAG TPA: heparan-alpha-glucosaminide N-acetyltransferase domain-containing protein, partial [Gemmatimonadaceae bacterium]
MLILVCDEVPIWSPPLIVTKRARIESVDVLRGVIMIVMALDHVREFFGTPGLNPTDIPHTTVALFFTRWITHFCAPVFFLLTGTGAFLSLRRKSIPQLSRFLWTRGLWLIFLELVVTRCLGWQFNFDYRLTLLFVLWALGWSMIALAALVHLPTRAVAIVGMIMIAAHNLLDSVSPAFFGALAPVWSILHVPGMIVSTPRFSVFEAYPLIPWIGVTAVGF